MRNNEFNEYDNIDRDVIVVNKDTLRLRLSKPLMHAVAVAGIAGWFSTGAAFIIAALLTEGFVDVLFIPGETIRTFFLVLGVVSLWMAGRATVVWFQTKEESSLDAAIQSFLPNSKPIALLSGPKVDLSVSQKPKRKILSVKAKR